MTKKTIFGIISALVLFTGISGANNSTPQTNVETQSFTDSQVKAEHTKPIEKVTPICDGTKVTSNCSVGGVSYSSYVYHTAVAEKSHVVTDTTYEENVSGYCTLCNDQTYSPSCATGRGACSYHGGVAQWNAPVYTKVAVKTPRTVIDAPAVDAYYEKIAN